MAGCTQVNCTFVYITPFEANPDISGIGVIIAFFAAAWFTCAIVLLGYLFVDGGVPDSYLNDLDLFFLSKTLAWKNRFIKRFFPTKLSFEKPISRSALQKSALMLSDQQMVTGVAVLIIGYGMHCNVSQYHFEIIADLASLAFNVLQATILVTLPVIRETPVMRHWRAIWITAHFAFLFMAQIVTYHPDFLWSYGMSTQCIWNTLSSVGYSSQLGSMFIYLASLSWAYLDIMSAFYPRQLGWSSYIGYVFEKIFRAPAKLHSRTKHRLNEQTISWKKALGRVLTALTYALFVFVFIFSEVVTSVFFHLVRIFAMLLWASMYIGQYRNSSDSSRVEGMQGDENEWTVGQIMPLMLLLLPIFGILETYCDNWVTYRRNARSENLKKSDETNDSSETISQAEPGHNNAPPQSEESQDPTTARGKVSSLNPMLYITLVFNANRRAVFKPRDTLSLSPNTTHDPGDLKLLAKASTFELEYRIYESFWFRYALLCICSVVVAGLVIAASFGIAI